MINNLNLNILMYTSIFLFTTGLWGIFVLKKNLILMLISIELLLLSANFSFIFSSIYFDDIIGQIFSLFIVTIAAAESAIGLAIFVAFYRLRNEIAIDYINNLKG